jgi:asparagine synthase (glutamine-hydrolysing)
MYLLSRFIKSKGIKVVLTGEGADEIFGGYLYFHKAPNKEELHKECVRKCKDLYKYDLARANKSTMAWGIEVRPPFM